MPQKNKSYWWKDKSGKWHYHKPGTAPATGYTDTSTTKPTGAATVSTGATASGGRPTTSTTKPDVSVSGTPSGPTRVPNPKDPGFYKPNQVQSGTRPNQLPAATQSTGMTKNSYVPPGGGKAQAKADWKAGWQPSDKSGGNKSSGAAPKVKSLSSLAQSKSLNPPSGGGKGLDMVNSGRGSRKVYDDAKSRLLKKKKGGYRP